MAPSEARAAEARELLVADLMAAETVFVLESFCEAPRPQVAEAVRSLLAFDSVVVVDPPLLLRAIEVYETDRLDFAEAYLVACARHLPPIEGEVEDLRETDVVA